MAKYLDQEGLKTAWGAIKGKIDKEIEKIPKVEVDAELSETSENPIQNKVIATVIGNINAVLDDINGEVIE